MWRSRAGRRLRLLSAAAVALFGLSGAAGPAAGEQARDTPKWVHRPSSRDIDHNYPYGAARQNVEGRALVQCKFDELGTLHDCTAIAEEPKGFGFGPAAMRMTALYKARPKPGLQSTWVTVPITFTRPSARSGPLP